MKLADDDLEWPAPPGPPVPPAPPLMRPALPPPDWRGEDAAQRKLMREIDEEGT